MPTTLTVADFLSLRMQYKAEQAENEIPAVIEHNFKDGRMVDHYFVVPGPALLADEAVQDFGGKIENILFLQQSEPGAPWQVPVSYTHLDVYKRQVCHCPCTRLVRPPRRRS